MDPIQKLMTEHRMIERVLSALEGYASRVEASEVEERGELLRFTDFLRGFADELHHGKEEDILFARMVEHGFPREVGPIAVMLEEHTQGRDLVREMRDLAGSTKPWGADERRKVAAAATGFAGLLRAHIQKEDLVLYPMSQQQLPTDVQHEVAETVSRHEAEHMEAERRLTALGEELEARWG